VVKRQRNRARAAMPEHGFKRTFYEKALFD